MHGFFQWKATVSTVEADWISKHQLSIHKDSVVTLVTAYVSRQEVIKHYLINIEINN